MRIIPYSPQKERRKKQQLQFASNLILLETNFINVSFSNNQFIKDVEFTKNLLENSNSISEKDLMKQLKSKLIVSTINKKRVSIIKEFIKQRYSKELAAKIKS